MIDMHLCIIVFTQHSKGHTFQDLTTFSILGYNGKCFKLPNNFVYGNSSPFHLSHLLTWERLTLTLTFSNLPHPGLLHMDSGLLFTCHSLGIISSLSSFPLPHTPSLRYQDILHIFCTIDQFGLVQIKTWD